MRDKWPFSREKVGELPRATCVGRLVLSTRHDGSSQHSCRHNCRDVLPFLVGYYLHVLQSIQATSVMVKPAFTLDSISALLSAVLIWYIELWSARNMPSNSNMEFARDGLLASINVLWRHATVSDFLRKIWRWRYTKDTLHVVHIFS